MLVACEGVGSWGFQTVGMDAFQSGTHQMWPQQLKDQRSSLFPLLILFLYCQQSEQQTLTQTRLATLLLQEQKNVFRHLMSYSILPWRHGVSARSNEELPLLMDKMDNQHHADFFLSALISICLLFYHYKLPQDKRCEVRLLWVQNQMLADILPLCAHTANRGKVLSPTDSTMPLSK